MYCMCRKYKLHNMIVKVLLQMEWANSITYSNCNAHVREHDAIILVILESFDLDHSHANFVLRNTCMNSYFEIFMDSKIIISAENQSSCVIYTIVFPRLGYITSVFIQIMVSLTAMCLFIML